MNPTDPQIVDAAPLRYLLSVPGSPPLQRGPAPVLCFLHGYDEAAPTEIRRGLTRHGPFASIAPASVADQFILLAPQLPAAGDLWHRFADAVAELVAQVQQRHGGNRARTYLTGFSYGGNGVFDLALRQRGLWSALWAVDPTRAPPEDPGLPVWLSSGEVSRRRRDAFLHRLRLSPLDGEEPAADGVYQDHGLDHVGTAAAAYRDPRIYAWLLSHGA